MASFHFRRPGLRTSFFILLILQVVFSGGAYAREEIVAAVPGPFPPQYLVEENSEVSGFAIDVMNEVAALAGVDVRYEVMDSWKQAHDALRDRRVDVIPNMGITRDRKAFADFTAPVETFPISIFVREGTVGIRSIADLVGRKVGVIKINAAYPVLKNREDMELVLFDHRGDLLFSLLSGAVDAVAFPEPLLLLDARRARVENLLRPVGLPLREIKRAIAVAKGKENLLVRLDESVRRFTSSKRYHEIYVKWFGKPEPLLTWNFLMYLLSGIFVVFAVAFSIYRWVLKRRQQFIEANEKKYRQLFSQMVSGFALHKMIFEDQKPVDYQFIEVNPMFEEMTGLSSQQVVGKTVKSVLPNVEHEWIERFGKVAQYGEHEQFEQFSTELGKYFDVKAYSPKQGYFAAIFSDITERKQDEEKLRQAFNEIEAIFNASSVGMIYLKNRREVYRINQRMADILGYAIEDVAGRSVDFLHTSKEEYEEFVTRHQEKLSLGEIVQEEYRFRHKDGSPVWCMLYGKALKPNNLDYGVIWVIEDISSRKKLEQLKEDVNRIVIHDLRSPLSGIITVPRILLTADNLTEDQRTIIKGIEDYGYRLLKQVNLSLDLYKMESGSYDYTPSEFDICISVDRLRNELETLLRDGDVTLAIYINGQRRDLCTDVYVKADEMLIHTMLSNLITNAIEASPHGEEVRVDIDEREEGYVISIHNKGAVPKKIRENFFEKYATSGKKAGTGLGTYSAKLMAEAMKGTIAMETSTGKGTTITVFIPISPVVP